MEPEDVSTIKEEPVSDTSLHIIDDGIDDMVQEMQRLDRERHEQIATVAACRENSLPEHDVNSFYNIHSMASQQLEMATGEMAIVINPKAASPLYDQNNLEYDRELLNRADVWHQVMVHHNSDCSKAKILEMLFSSFPVHDFFPVAYRRHMDIDFFLLRMCHQVLVKLFSDGLRLKSGKLQLLLSVRLGAARFIEGQIFPRRTITRAVQERCKNASQYGSMDMLNLDSFAGHAYMDDLCINLGNRSQFEVVCSAIAQVLVGTSSITMLRLSNNCISHVNLLATVKGNLISLDLRGNRIKHPSALRQLKDMPLIELYVEGNSLINVPNYQKLIFGFFPKLLKLDSSLTELSAAKAATNTGEVEEEEVELTSPGTLLTDADLTPNSFHKYQLSPHWHLLAVHHEGVCGKQEIFDALFKLLGMRTFFPCHYKTYSKKDEFLVRNSFEALMILVKQKLKLPVPACNTVLKLSLTMNVAEPSDKDVVPLKKLEHFVKKRYQQGCLDLCAMQAELNEYKFVDFYVKCGKTLEYIMSIASRKLGSHCLILRLRHNDLQSCEALGHLSGFPKLVSLDLRFNSLATFADLNHIPFNRIKEVYLDNNPLCGTVSSSVEYARKARICFSQLQRLDGRALLANFSFCQNFICTPEAYKFAELFVKHYYTLYDSFQRSDLRDLYHPMAQFSMTCGFESGDDHSKDQQATWAQYSRNILQFKGNLNRAMLMLIVGNERIGIVQSSFPNSELDFSSLRIDVPIFTPENVLIIVHGRSNTSSMSGDRYLCFTRTWFIKPCGPGTNLFEETMEYKIHNDMLHLYTMTDERNEFNADRNVDQPGTDVSEDSSMCDSVDRESVLIVFKQLTRLNDEWSTRCLEESSWNLKVALNVFLKLYEFKRIPKAAFNT